jgi:hypothetical protein
MTLKGVHMPESFAEAAHQSITGRLDGDAVRQYVLDRGGILTIDQATMPGG